MSRVRTNTQTVTNGYWEKFGVKHGFNNVNRLNETCTDEVLSGDCNNLSIVRTTTSGGVANSKRNRGYYGLNAYDFVLDSVTGGWAQCFGPITSYPGEKPDAAYAAAAVARTNPSRPYVDIPVNVLELGDIARTIQIQGKTLLDKAAGHNLRYQFGIMPLVSDLAKLTRFSDAVHRRIKEFERLQSPRGLRRTIELDTLSVTHNRVSEYIQTGGFIDRQTFDTVGRRQIKAHVRWKAGGNFVKINQPEMCALAVKTVLGLTLDASTLWEAMPWSWLIDWGTNLGDYLKAQRNIVPASLVGCWLMRHTTSTTYIPAHETPDERVSAISYQIENKNRTRAIVTPTAHFPFLTGNQLGILASLAITRS